METNALSVIHQFLVFLLVINDETVDRLTFVILQGHIYNSTSRIRNRKEKKSWLGYAQVGESTIKQTFLSHF